MTGRGEQAQIDLTELLVSFKEKTKEGHHADDTLTATSENCRTRARAG